MSPDAARHRPDPRYTRGLIDKATSKLGSRELLAERTGISLRRLRYLYAGERAWQNKVLPVRTSYSEQFILETIANG